MKSANFVAIMALLAEMTRRLNENIDKVHLAPIEAPLGRALTVDRIKALLAVSNG